MFAPVIHPIRGTRAWRDLWAEQEHQPPGCHLQTESFTLSQCFQGKDNICPWARTAPCTTHPSKDHFQSTLGKDISLPHCPAPSVAMQNTSGIKKNIIIIPLLIYFFFNLTLWQKLPSPIFTTHLVPRLALMAMGNNVALRLPVRAGGGTGCRAPRQL